jgi:hypothetical protein
MKKLKITSAILLLAATAYSQGRLVINDNAFVVIDNTAKVVVENSAANGVTTLGTGANIVTESEFDQVIWNVGTSTGNYVMPFTSQGTFTKIPFSANITGAGVGVGRIAFSTYPGPTWDNNTYRPSDVTHMFDYNTNSVNNSDHVIDRFWIIDALGYGTKPSATFQFTYRDVEHTQVGNNIVEASLGAQRFHPGPNVWGDYLPQGVTNVALNTTSAVPVSSANFFRSWTLSETTNPLAVELAYYKSVCDKAGVLLEWKTLTESEVDHFDLYHVDINATRTLLTQVPAQNIPNSTYSYHSSQFRDGIFELVEVSQDGQETTKGQLSANCLSTANWIHFDPAGQSLILGISSGQDELLPLKLYDAAGKLVFVQDIQVHEGMNQVVLPLQTISNGMYQLISDSVQNPFRMKFAIY